MKLRLFIPALALSLLLSVSPANATTGQNNADNGVCGGWDEKTGYFATVTDYNNYLKANGSLSITSTPVHTGQRETQIINGTSNYRAHGWTTWVGEYHYTRARMEEGSAVLTDSGRIWGSNGTEAISPWWAFIPPDLDGSARTYYGH